MLERTLRNTVLEKECIKCNIVKELNLFAVASRNRDGHTGSCKACRKLQNKKYYIENKEHITAINNQYREDNKEATIFRGKQYYQKTKVSRSEKSKQYYLDNKEAIASQGKQYRQDNKDKCNAKAAKYRAAKLNAIPSWFSDWDRFVLDEAYSTAKYREEQTGVKHHVDHTVPLQGKLVSGLHCADNIQVITAKENLVKSNKWEP